VLTEAFGGQVLTLPDGSVLVDQCACNQPEPESIVVK
ncbi:MAG: metal ABC transporter ATP-binding protein, partial [Roseiflexus castenholzii]